MYRAGVFKLARLRAVAMVGVFVTVLGSALLQISRGQGGVRHQELSTGEHSIESVWREQRLWNSTLGLAGPAKRGSV